jgi:hypothetical protein
LTGKNRFASKNREANFRTGIDAAAILVARGKFSNRNGLEDLAGCGKSKLWEGSNPRRLKPGLILARLAVRLEAAPFQNSTGLFKLPRLDSSLGNP